MPVAFSPVRRAVISPVGCSPPPACLSAVRLRLRDLRGDLGGAAGIPQDQIEWHELFANVASWGFVILTAWRMFLTEERRRALAVYTVVGFCWYGLLVITATSAGGWSSSTAPRWSVGAPTTSSRSTT